MSNNPYTKAVCFSQRTLNSFHGAMNIITTGDADAVATNGINRCLYIQNTFESHHDDPKEFSGTEMPELRFGAWSKTTGYGTDLDVSNCDTNFIHHKLSPHFLAQMLVEQQ